MANNPVADDNPAIIKNYPRVAWKKKLATTTRWLHIYLSMLSFAIVLFFAVTGLTLNHADYFTGTEHINKFSGKVLLRWVKSQDTAAIAKFEIVQFLKKSHHLKGEVSDFFIEDSQCSVSFKGPGYSADAFIDRSNGEYKITESMLGLVAIMNDLHKGRDTGKTWSYIIDASAIFMTVISLTGIIMMGFMKKKRLKAFVIAFIGVVIAFLFYLL